MPTYYLQFSFNFAHHISAVNQNQGFSNQLFGNQFNRNQQLLPKHGVSASCQERNGRFPVQNQCDAYIECIDGVPEEKLCPEGLVFNPEARFNYPCGYPIDVDCTSRPNLRKSVTIAGTFEICSRFTDMCTWRFEF